jgi:hypothetical protein
MPIDNINAIIGVLYMNISQTREHSYSPYNNARFNNANVNTQQNGNSHGGAAFGSNPAATVTISSEAWEKIVNISQEELLAAAKNGPKSLTNCVKDWYYEVHVEAYKNGTSFKVAMEEHGMEIAEFFAGECVPDSVEEFLDGVAKYMNGQSFEEAFGDDFNKDDFEMTKGMSERLVARVRIDLENNIKYVYSHRLDDFVCPPIEEKAEPVYKEDALSSEKIKQYRETVAENISDHVLEQLNIRNIKPKSHRSAYEHVKFIPEAEKPLGKPAPEDPAESVIFKALDGKVEDAKEVAKELRNMIFSLKESNLQVRAEDREAARNIAEYIAENCLSPEEAKAFMVKINEYIESSEMRDKGGHKGSFIEIDMFAEDSFAQTVINNAKQITDFSSNEKWKAVMNLLPKFA